jgi:hypothetical protein
MAATSTKLLWVLIACIAITACRKKPAAAPDQSAPQAGGTSVESLVSFAPKNPPPPLADSAASPGDPPANVDAPQAPAAPVPEINEVTSGTEMNADVGKELKGGELATPQVLATYNKRLAMVNYQISDFPSDLEQLKKWPMMPPLPKAPSGKRIVYDLRTKKIRLDPP